MGILIAILIIVVIFLYFRTSKIAEKFEEAQKEIDKLRREFASLYEFVRDFKKAQQTTKAEAPLSGPGEEPAKTAASLTPSADVAAAVTLLSQPATKTDKEPPTAAAVQPAMPIASKPVVPTVAPLTPKPEIPPASAIPASEGLRPFAASTTVSREEPQKTQKPEPVPHQMPAWEDKWEEFRANVDWEQFTGIKLFAWLGGLALFIAAIFFVKYSIDNNLIPVQVRLAIGALVGIALVASSLFINREQYKTTAHSLAAGGIAVLYAVSFTATVYYGLIPKTVGFGLFCLISAAAFVLAVFHQGRFISVLGALGAYATPLLIQTGHPNLIGLFGYLTVVNLGMFEVIRRTGWLPLYVLTTAGTLFTLSAGAWGTKPPSENNLICIIVLVNLVVFSIFFRLYRGADSANRSIIISLRLLFLSALAVAVVIIDAPGFLSLLIIAVATLAALVLAYQEKSWSKGFIYYSLIGFVILIIWAVARFDLREPSWGMLIFFVYALVAGLGPVFIIRRNGVEPLSLQWLKIFPAALVLVAVAVFIKAQTATFLFWPLILGLNIIGIFVSLIIGSLVSLAVIVVLFLSAGIYWVVKTPVIQIGNEFFLVILAAALVLCFVTLLFLKNAKSWNPLSAIEEIKTIVTPDFIMKSEWISSLPILGPFVLLALVLIRQQPLAPNPAMATGLCFFAIVIFLVRRIKAQEILIVSLVAMALTTLSWGLMIPQGDKILSVTLIYWSALLWLVALILPNFLFRPEGNWKLVWFGWALFELVQALLIIRAANMLWVKEIYGWFPLALAALKLPVVAILIKRLEGVAERNAILAFHGGVLLFYVSSVAVMLLGNAWLGVTLTVEATLLLWLNRRVEHPGLRWVSLFLAPTGIALVISHLNTLKTAQDLPVLNLAILSIVIIVAALSFSVKLADYPQKEIASEFSLPGYFLWLAIGMGFYLVNLLVADIFGGAGGGFQFNFIQNINQYVSTCLLWSIFGAVLWHLGILPKSLRVAGLILTVAGVLTTLGMPLKFAREIGLMIPLFNLGLVLFIPMVAVLAYLAHKQNDNDFLGNTVKYFFICTSLLIGLVALHVELSTVWQNTIPFSFTARPLPDMALALIASWFVFGFVLVLWPRELHNNFRLTGALLMVISLIRACLYPLRYAADFGVVTPLINMPSLVYLLLLAGLLILTVKRFSQEWIWRQERNPRNIWGTLLVIFAFYVMNVEVASFFGMFNTGAGSGSFTFYTHGRLSQQLAYSLSWLIFALGLLLIGIRWNMIRLRWVGLGLIVITALKVFLKDLWALGQLYRVFSFIGLAVTLTLVSFLYQRYFGTKKKKGEKE